MRNATHLLVEKNWYLAASDWKAHVMLGRRVGQALGADRYFELRYEDLLADPGAVFARLLDFIGAGAEAQAQLDRVRTGIARKMRSGNHDKWRTQMPPDAIRVVERVAGDTLDEFGYPLQYPAEAGRGYDMAHVAAFHVDRVVRNLFTRDFKKFLRSHRNNLTSAARARLGSVRTRRAGDDAASRTPGETVSH
jgi:hypothetical protein